MDWIGMEGLALFHFGNFNQSPTRLHIINFATTTTTTTVVVVIQCSKECITDSICLSLSLYYKYSLLTAILFE